VLFQFDITKFSSIVISSHVLQQQADGGTATIATQK
jgi:hypothetical protein